MHKSSRMPLFFSYDLQTKLSVWGHEFFRLWIRGIFPKFRASLSVMKMKKLVSCFNVQDHQENSDHPLIFWDAQICRFLGSSSSRLGVPSSLWSQGVLAFFLVSSAALATRLGGQLLCVLGRWGVVFFMSKKPAGPWVFGQGSLVYEPCWLGLTNMFQVGSMPQRGCNLLSMVLMLQKHSFLMR